MVTSTGFRVLHRGAGPSLPRADLDAIDGTRIEPAIGSCGTAASTGETVPAT